MSHAGARTANEGEYDPIFASEKDILTQLGLWCKPQSQKPVDAVSAPHFVQQGKHLMAVADRQPPLQGVDTCEYAMKNLIRFAAEQKKKKIVGKCPHGFACTDLDGAHCIAVTKLTRGAVRKNSHRKEFVELQQTLYQLAAVKSRAVHRSDAAIRYGLHSLEVAKQTGDSLAQTLAQRGIALAYNSKKMSSQLAADAAAKLILEADKHRAMFSSSASGRFQEEKFSRTDIGDARDNAMSLVVQRMKMEMKRKEEAAIKEEKRKAKKAKENQERWKDAAEGVLGTTEEE